MQLRSTSKVEELLLAARLLALLPPAIGITIFLLWLVTGSVVLMHAGYFTILVGVACAGGSLLLLTYTWFLTQRGWRPYFYRKAWPTIALILVSFPLAWGLAAAAIKIESRSTVIVSLLGMGTGPFSCTSFDVHEKGPVPIPSRS